MDKEIIIVTPTPEQFYESVLKDVPDLDPSKKEQIMFAAQELIKAGAGTLELPATGENMMKWLEAQPRIWPEAKHDRFIKQMNGQSDLLSNVSPSRDSWIPVALGMGGVSISIVVSQTYARTEVFINRGDQEENKKIFDYFY